MKNATCCIAKIKTARAIIKTKFVLMKLSIAGRKKGKSTLALLFFTATNQEI